MTENERFIDFDMSEKELEKAIESYKNKVKEGEIETPCPSDWYAFIGFNIDQMRELYVRGLEDKNRYSVRALAAKKMLDWCRNQLVVHPYWCGKNAVKSMYLLKQDWGDGVKWTDDARQAKASGSPVVLQFGGNDKRSGKASK